MDRSDRYLLEGVFLVVLVAFSVAFYRIMAPFILDIFVALVLANIFHRPFQWLHTRTGNARIASTLTIFMVLVTVAVPVTLIVALVSAELAGSVANFRENWSSVQQSTAVSGLIRSVQEIPVVGTVVNRFSDGDVSGAVRDLLSTSSDYLLRLFQRSIGNIVTAVFNFLIVLLLVFFFLLDGKAYVRRIYETIPVRNQELDQIVGETFSTTSATLISTVIIGILEGALATILFAAFSLPSPFFWGVVTMVLSMIPLIGSNLIIIPAGIVVAVGGGIVGGIVIIVTGIVGVAITQNLVKPKLVGDRTGLHPALALLSTIGGIAWLGIIGFLIGPVIASLFIVVWRQFSSRYTGMLEEKDSL